MNGKRTSGCVAAWLLMAAVACLGCRSRSTKEYMPQDAAAKNAVVTALAAWQAGKPPGVFEPDQPDAPQVQAVDSEWSGGTKKLAQFEVVEQLPSAGGPPKFKVRLKYSDLPDAIEVTYYVVGKKPLLVYRDMDFESQTKGM